MSRQTFFAVAFGSLAAGSLALTAAVLVAPPASAAKDPASLYGVINATVNAATVHEVAGSTALVDAECLIDHASRTAVVGHSRRKVLQQIPIVADVLV